MKPMRALKQCLVDTELAHLRVIARLWGLEIKAKRHLEIAAELADALADPTHAVAAWRALSEAERAALGALLDAGGQMPTATFSRRFGEIRPMGPGRLERETPWRDPVSPAEGLWFRGFIFEDFAQAAGETFPVLFVPPDLRTALPVQAGVQERFIQLPPTDPPANYRSGGDLLLDDTTTVLAFVHNEFVRPLPGSLNTWRSSAYEAVAPLLRDSDTNRLAFILHLIAHLGWVRLGSEQRLRLVPEPVTAWLNVPVRESQKVLVDAWSQMMDWNELKRLTTLQPDDAGTWHNDPTLARAALLRHLDALTPGEWVQLTDFVDAIKAIDPDFQRPSGDYETWYVRDSSSGAYLKGFESWEQVDGALLRALLTGPAEWLGLVELGGDTGGAVPTVFRVRPDAPSVDETVSPEVGADLTVTMPAALRYERFQLCRVADLAKADDPYVYRLTPASLSRARQQRINVEKIQSFLDGLSDAPLPRAVRESVTRWARQGTEVWLEGALLLRTTDEKLLQRIVAAPQAGRYIDRVVGTTVAVVAAQDWPGLAAALADLGLLADLVGVGDTGFRDEKRKSEH